jgi:hypothetical protein
MNLHFLFMVCALLAGESRATSFFIRPMPEFTRDADLIVRGKLHEPHAEYGFGPGGERMIRTYAELESIEVLKGNAPGTTLTIRKDGGTKDGIALHVPGSPEFEDGEESLFFLGPENEDHSRDVMGLELGKFGLQEKNGELELSGGLLGYSYGPEALEAMGPGIPENRRVWTLKQLKELIETQKSAPGNPKSGDAGSAGKPEGSPGPVGRTSPDPLSKTPPSSPEPGGSAFTGDSTNTAEIAGGIFLVVGALLGIIFLYLRRK